MKQLVSVVKELPKLALLEVRYLYDCYPARFISTAAAAVVFAAAHWGIVVKSESVQGALALALPVLLGGTAIHRKVKPVK